MGPTKVESAYKPFTPHRGSGYIVATPQSFNFWLASPSSHLRPLAGALRVVPVTRCAYKPHHRNKSLRRAEDLNFYGIFITIVKERILLSLTALNINNKRKRQLPNIGDQDR